MATTFSHASPTPAFGPAPGNRVQRAPRSGSTPHGWVDALVTLAVMAWFSAAFASMVGEFHGALPAAATQDVARELPPALPLVSTSPGNSTHARMALI